MATIPRTEATKRKLKLFFESQDIHRWVYGREKGKGGYEHYQLRFEWLDEHSNDGFTIFKDWFYSGHLEVAKSEGWEYEKSEGKYFSWDDNYPILRRRYGKFTPYQQVVFNLAKESNDRQIIVWVQPDGGSGKSFFTSALWERRLAHNILPSNTAKGLIQDVASEVIENGKRPFITIDIPRTWKWTDELYFAIEKIKDGLIKDTRYHSRTVNIVGTAIIVLCNEAPKLSKLSSDRWVIYNDGHPIR